MGFFRRELEIGTQHLPMSKTYEEAYFSAAAAKHQVEVDWLSEQFQLSIEIEDLRDRTAKCRNALVQSKMEFERLGIPTASVIEKIASIDQTIKGLADFATAISKELIPLFTMEIYRETLDELREQNEAREYVVAAIADAIQ